MAFARLLAFAADDMSSLYLSARNLSGQRCTMATAYFLSVGRETPARASIGLAFTHSCDVRTPSERENSETGNLGPDGHSLEQAVRTRVTVGRESAGGT